MKKRKKKYFGLSTRIIHMGEGKNPYGAHSTPIFQTGTFVFNNLSEAAKAFKGEGGYSYTRLDNPNFRVVEQKIADLEGGEDALVFSSGMSAIDTTIQYLLRKGGHVICTRTLYGCTEELFVNLLPDPIRKFSFIDTCQPENVRKAIQEAIKRDVKTIVVFLETPANPTLDLADIKAISDIAHGFRASNREVYVVADNSFATPFNQKPIKLGADIVIQSVTKYLNGHGDLIMGATVGKSALIREGKDSLSHWRAIKGPVPGPHDCALASRGLKTFTLRMQKHNENGYLMAKFLEDRGLRVIYPGLKSHLQYEIAKKQMSPGFSGMVSFELKGGLGAARKFLDHISKEFVSLAVSLGYIETLAQSPALMTHALIPRKKRLEKGITDGLIRISFGLEDYEDLKECFTKALKAAGN